MTLRFAALISNALSVALLTSLLLGNGPAFAADTLESLISQGNAAAEKQDYGSAIRFYEQARLKSPQEKVLKNNLAVLYANYAVSLQEQKKYAEAFKFLDKGLALATTASKEERNIQGAKASVYFSQAMDLKEAAQNNTNGTTDFAPMKALVEKALVLSPNEMAFKKGMASIYLEEAYQLASQERFSDAAPLLENALTYDPQSRAVKQSLANVYLGQARNDYEHRKALVEKALATDDSPKVKQVADKLLSQDSASTSESGSFAASPNEAKGSVSKAASQLSVAEMIHDMEAQLQVTPAKNATLNDRLDTLEKQILGKSQSGALATRTKTAYSTLMGGASGSLEQSNVALTQSPLARTDNNYVNEVFKVTDGKVVRWGKFPIRVYFEEPKENPLYKPEYKEAALKGFEIWKERTNGFANYLEIKNAQAADVVVSWTDNYVDRFADPENLPTVYKNYKPPKKSHLMTAVQMASMMTPGYFSLAPQAASAALQYQQYKKLLVIQEESKIRLGLAPTQNLNQDAAKVLIQNMAAKEFGHALGIKGVSPQKGDLLYADLRSDTVQAPSNRDLETLREIYNRPPNILLNTH